MFSPSQATRPKGRKFYAGNQPPQGSQKPQLHTSNNHDEYSIDIENAQVGPKQFPSHLAGSDRHEQLPYAIMVKDVESNRGRPLRHLNGSDPNKELYCWDSDLEDVRVNPERRLSDITRSDTDEELGYSSANMGREQHAGTSPPTMLPKFSSQLREHFEDALKLFEATEVQVEELKQRVKGLEEVNSTISRRLKVRTRKLEAEIRESNICIITLQNQKIEDSSKISTLTKELVEEKRRAKENRYSKMERIYLLETELEILRKGTNAETVDEALQKRNAILQERTGILKRQPREGGDQQHSASDVEDAATEQPQLESAETLRLQCQELEDTNRGLREQHTKWRKLFNKFMQRATDVQRRDASNHQVQKAFKTLHKIVKEGEIQGL